MPPSGAIVGVRAGFSRLTLDVVGDPGAGPGRFTAAVPRGRDINVGDRLRLADRETALPLLRFGHLEE